MALISTVLLVEKTVLAKLKDVILYNNIQTIVLKTDKIRVAPLGAADAT